MLLSWPRGGKGIPGLPSSRRFSSLVSYPYESFSSMEATSGWGDTSGFGDLPLSVSVTPGSNTYGSYATVIGPLTEDCWYMEILVYLTAVDAVLDTIISFAIDPDGGSDFRDENIVIPHLLTGGVAYNSGEQAGIHALPLFVQKGCTIGAKASQNNVGPVAVEVGIRAYGQPYNPLSLRKGRMVDAIGIDTSVSSGTLVSQASSGAEGTWTQIGVAQNDYWWVVPCAAQPDGTMTIQVYWHEWSWGDVGGENPIADTVVAVSTSETARINGDMLRRPVYLPAGAKVWARSSASGTADTNRMALLGVRL